VRSSCSPVGIFFFFLLAKQHWVRCWWEKQTAVGDHASNISTKLCVDGLSINVKFIFISLWSWFGKFIDEALVEHKLQISYWNLLTFKFPERYIHLAHRQNSHMYLSASTLPKRITCTRTEYVVIQNTEFLREEEKLE